MDNPGWHASRRAAQEQRDSHRYRGPDGRFTPVEQVFPMQDGFVGGFNPYSHNTNGPPTPGLPQPGGGDFKLRMPSATEPMNHHSRNGSRSTMDSSRHLSAVERSNQLRMARMQPHLQMMCGPLLRYDTVTEDGVWRGAALIVTADVGSVYEPAPTLTYTWDPDEGRVPKKAQRATSISHRNGRSFDLGPHPADPSAMSYAPPLSESSSMDGPRSQARQAVGQEIWVYEGNGGTSTFWRFIIEIPLSESEVQVRYNVNNGQDITFHVPGRYDTMRQAAYSCNGFSAGVNPDDFRGPGFASGYDPVWVDLLMKHEEKPFHLLMGGGDQLYCDGLTREPEMQDWVTHPDVEEKKRMQLTDDMRVAIDRFYFNHYCNVFRSGAFARANCSIPMANMADDHDLIDGFGSYPDDLMRSPVFSYIGARGYFYFLLFQCFISPDIDGYDDSGPQTHWMRSLIIGGPGVYIPFPSHSFLSYLGPTTQLLMLDCRAERKLDQVCSAHQYEKVFGRVNQMQPGVEHLVLQLGIPIAYPRMVFLENFLSNKFNPLVSLGRSGSMLKGMVNKFNADAELLDDLNDHWTSKHHKSERNWFIEQLQAVALHRRLRISFVSGDVHCGAVGMFKTLVKNKKQPDINPAIDHRYMVNIVTSAIVNTPPPAAVLSLVNSLSSKTHATMHSVGTDETMIPIFQTDTDGSKQKSPYIIGRRNWCAIFLDHTSGDLVFDLRVEKVKGHGETVGYITRVPAPRWQAPPRR
ncbi:hypothetical protein PENSPDRAFT_650377 [Peniophora sp. CONT]|nr:hypothetical protein PENSPDRAFT_650377 [Peniophora sp. CONT]